jgi:hypothetical protein
MKRLFLVILALASLPAFSQEDEYAKFQGVWYGTIGNEFIFYIFIDNSFTMIRQDSTIIGMYSGKYSIDKEKLIFEINKLLIGKDSFYIPYDDGIQDAQMQYAISGGILVLFADDGTITSLKNVER